MLIAQACSEILELNNGLTLSQKKKKRNSGWSLAFQLGMEHWCTGHDCHGRYLSNYANKLSTTRFFFQCSFAL